MGNLSKELSSWRKQIVTCKSGIITTIDFMDTRPNIMFIMNPTEAILLASIDHSPTPKNYDFKIKEHYTRLIGKPTRTRQCYIYNDSPIDCDVQVYSLYDEKFDPSWIKDFNIENVNISNETLEAIKDMITGKVVIDGVKDGVILPVKDDALFNKIEQRLSEILSAINDTSGNTLLVSIRNILDSLTKNRNATSHYVSLTAETAFKLTHKEFTRTTIDFIMGNGILRFTKNNNNIDIPVNGFMRDLQFVNSDYSIEYIKPTDEIENAYILYKVW